MGKYPTIFKKAVVNRKRMDYNYNAYETISIKR